MDDRQRRALAFAMAGVDWELIAQQCGYADRAEAVADVEGVLTAQVSDDLSTQATRALNVARLSRLLSGVWTPAVAGNNRAVEVSSALIRQLCKMQGVEEVKPGEIPEHQAVQSVYDELAARRPGTPSGPRKDGNGRRRGRRV